MIILKSPNFLSICLLFHRMKDKDNKKNRFLLGGVILNFFVCGRVFTSVLGFPKKLKLRNNVSNVRFLKEIDTTKIIVNKYPSVIFC